MAPYQYTPLGQNDIRLLLIRPGKLGNPIHCELQQHNLSSAPEYNALSYCWGPPVFDKALYISSSRSGETSRNPFARLKSRVETSKMLITKSLHSALSRIRMSDQAVLVWADAVCIDQRNVAEKNVQVQLMREIYKRASQTLIHVGEEADDSQLVPSLVKQILDVNIRPMGIVFNVVSKDLPPEDDKVWSAWDAFFRRPWFHRVWVIQEVALAARAIILCGAWRLDFTDVAQAAESPVEQWTKDKTTTVKGQSMATLMNALRERVLEAEPISLLGLIYVGRSAMATEPVDYMYGVLGLSMEAQRPELKADYGESLSNTLRRYAKFFVANGNGMELLSYVNCSTWRTGHPTWFPHWASHEKKEEKFWDYSNPLSRHYPFKAAGDTEYHMTHVEVIEDSVNWLVLKGVAIDEIHQVGDDHRGGNYGEPMMDEIFDHPLCTWLLEPEYLYETSKDADPSWRSWYNTREEWFEAKWQTMVAGTMEPIPVGGHFTRYTYADCYNILKNATPGPEDPNASFDYQSTLFDYFNNITKITSSLVLCTTKMYGWLGRVPHGTQVGDTVVLFLGAKVPFVLRRRPEGQTGYMVVGACYMHGIMRGELKRYLGEENNPALHDWVLS